MQIEITAAGGPASGKTYMLEQIKEFLEDKDFSVMFPNEKCNYAHEHMLIATRSDDWVKENVVKK